MATMAERCGPEEAMEAMEAAESLLQVEEDRAIRVVAQPSRVRVAIGAAVGLAVAAALVVALSLRGGAAATRGAAVGDATELWNDNYDCDDGFTNWELGWSESKKVYCCEHAGRACSSGGYAGRQAAVVSEHIAAALPYDCNAGLAKWEDGWSVEKKTWCCDHTGRGCEGGHARAEAYDCNAGFANWKEGWSGPKKQWCCHHVGRGCEFRREDDFDIQASGWGGNSVYNSVHGHTGASVYNSVHGHTGASVYNSVHGHTGAAYNCDDGYANWRAGWSMGKKDYCCSHTGRGCDPAGSDPATAQYHAAGDFNGMYHEDHYHAVYHGDAAAQHVVVHHHYDPAVHHVCSYHVGEHVSVKSHGVWHRARVIGHAGDETYRVMLEKYGEEMTAPCAYLKTDGPVYPASLWVLLVISIVAIVIGLWATFGAPKAEGEQKWSPAVWAAVILAVIAVVTGLLVAFHK